MASGDKCFSLGAVAGRIDQKAVIENCVFSGVLKGFSGAAIGGIVGHNNSGSVRSCSVSADIATGAANPEEAKKTRIGGIVGCYECYDVGPSIENSIFTGSIRYKDGSASMRVGGIAGENFWASCIIQNCAVSADIDVSGGTSPFGYDQWINCAGGAAGYNGGTINNVAVTGSVKLHADDAQNDVAAGGACRSKRLRTEHPHRKQLAQLHSLGFKPERRKNLGGRDSGLQLRILVVSPSGPRHDNQQPLGQKEGSADGGGRKL